MPLKPETEFATKRRVTNIYMSDHNGYIQSLLQFAEWYQSLLCPTPRFVSYVLNPPLMGFYL